MFYQIATQVYTIESFKLLFKLLSLYIGVVIVETKENYKFVHAKFEYT
jgi:hypothetical protein